MQGIINNIGWVSKKPPNQQYMNRSLEAGAKEISAIETDLFHNEWVSAMCRTVTKFRPGPKNTKINLKMWMCMFLCCKAETEVLFRGQEGNEPK